MFGKHLGHDNLKISHNLLLSSNKVVQQISIEFGNIYSFYLYIKKIQKPKFENYFNGKMGKLTGKFKKFNNITYTLYVSTKYIFCIIYIHFFNFID